MLTLVPIAIGTATLLIALALPKWYSATTKIMPPQQSQSAAVALLGQLNVLPSAAQTLGIKNPSEIYITILRSRTIADRLIDRFGLLHVYGEEFLQDARLELARNTLVSAGRDGVITIDVEDKDPVRASEIANSYVEELRNLSLNLAVSEASQRRLFFEGQLQRAKTDLANSEIALQKYVEEAGLVNPQGQILLSVTAAASLSAQIAAKRIQLAAMRTFATESNPDIRRTNQELLGLQAELAKLERTAGGAKGDVLVPFGKAPEVGLEYLRRYRDLKYFETLYDVLAKQYELARIDEAKDATVIQVLDRALVPERKSRPKILLIAVLSTIGSGLALLFFLYVTRRTANGFSLSELRAAIRSHSS